MPIEIQVHQEGAGVVYDCQGSVTIQDFLDASKTFLLTPDEIKKWRYTIIDLTSVGPMEIGFQDVQTVVTLNREIANLGIPGVLLAVAAPGSLGFGLARMWEILSENTGWEIRTFRSRPEAEVWIRERAWQKFELRAEFGDGIR